MLGKAKGRVKGQRKDRAKGRAKGTKESGIQALKMTLAYVKQETLGQLRSLGTFIKWGLIGSLLLAIGLGFTLLGILRLLQDETGSAMTGNLSWIPYVCVTFIALIFMGILVWRIIAKPSDSKIHSSNLTDKVTSYDSAQSST